MTGDEEMTGQWRSSHKRMVRQSQTAWQTSDFPDLFSNVMHKRLLAGYREVDYGIDRIVTVKPLTDFKTQTVVILGYYGDLSSVSEAAEYTTFAAVTDDKETYSPAKKGNTVDLTLEDIANDDLRGLRRGPDNMRRSA